MLTPDFTGEGRANGPVNHEGGPKSTHTRHHRKGGSHERVSQDAEGVGWQNHLLCTVDWM